MQRRFWTGDRLYYLLNLPPKIYTQIFTENQPEGLRQIRKKHKKSIMAGLEMSPEKPKDFNHEDSPETMARKLEAAERIAGLISPDNIDPNDPTTSYHYGYIKNADGEIEYTKPLPSVRRGAKIETWPQATPAKITPSKKLAPKRDYKTLFVFSDAQIDYRRIGNELIPIHDERALKVARMLCADLQPDEIINLGDTIDLSSLSRFKLDSDHFSRTLSPSFQRVHDLYAGFRADNPKAKITEVDSNHNTRLKDFMLKNAPQMYGLKQAGNTDEYGVMTYPFLANLKPLDINWVSGYGSAEYKYADDLIFKHGTMAVSNGSTAAKLSKSEPEMNVVQGHAHRAETFHRTTRNGKYLAAIIVGAMCKTTGEVPSYHSAVDDHNQVVRHQEDWVNAVLVVNHYGDGDYEFRHVTIRDGKLNFNEKEYKA